MAKKPAAPMPPKSHAESVGSHAHAAMQHLAKTGMQTASVDRTFAELQDEGPTARAPSTYPGKGAGK